MKKSTPKIPRFRKHVVNYVVYFFDWGRWWDKSFRVKRRALEFRDYQRNTTERDAFVTKEVLTREIVPDDSKPQGEN